MVMQINQNWRTVLILAFSVLLTSLICAADLCAQIREDEVDFQILATVTAQKDNGLWSLAEKYYGNPRLWPLISDMNRISDATNIPAGTTIYIPVKDAKRITSKPVKKNDSTALTTVTYRKGDSLWSLAEKHYGNPLLWSRIANANGISDATDIPVGTRIHIPARDAGRIADKLTVSVDSGILATVTYKKGDTLWNLAEKYYGNPWLWPRIADANGITDVTNIPPGTPIHIHARDAKQIGARIADTSRTPDKAPLPASASAHIEVKDPKRAIEKLVKEAGFEVMAVVFYQEDDTLRDLAKEYYGDPQLWSHIADANEISDEAMISVGTPIYIPAKAPEMPATKPKTPIKEPVQVIGKPTIKKVKPEKTKIGPPLRKKVEPRIADRIVSPFENYKIIEIKNLFRPMGWQERKSTEPPYVLAGIVGRAEERKALVVDEKENESYYISEGDSIGEAQAVEILEDHVMLSQEGKQFKIGFSKRPLFGSRRSSSSGRRRAGFPPDTESGVAPNYRSQTSLPDRAEAREYVDRWRSMDSDARQMFYSYIRRRSDVKLSAVFRDIKLRGRMMDEFYKEEGN
ncbi:LysM peptidoglycan-binding domain-containing protein [Candidatus Poribacteria bacterium]